MRRRVTLKGYWRSILGAVEVARDVHHEIGAARGVVADARARATVAGKFGERQCGPVLVRPGGVGVARERPGLIARVGGHEPSTEGAGHGHVLRHSGSGVGDRWSG